MSERNGYEATIGLEIHPGSKAKLATGQARFLKIV